MQKLLVKLFIKDYQKTEDPLVRGRYGTLSGIVGIITNLILCSIKIIIGLMSGSVSIMADGINNLSDAGSSVITLIGFKLSNMPADEEHPFGHQRIEYLTGMIVSFIILIIGFTLGKESILKIIYPNDSMKVDVIAIVIMALSIIVKCWQSYFYRKMGKTIQSETLIATASDSLNDCITTASVIIGMILYVTLDIKIDGYIGVFVSIFILVSGLKLVKETMNPLIGTTPSEEEIERIATKIKTYDGILGIHDLVIHSYGPNKTFVTVHAEVSRNQDIMLSHDIIDNIESDFRKELHIDLVIHMDPVDLDNDETNRLREVVTNIVKTYDNALNIHDFRVVHGVTHSNVLFDVVMPIKYLLTPQELKEELTKLIKIYDNFLNPVIQIDQFYNRNT